MRLLSLSLFLFVVFSLVGLGSLINGIYENQLQKQEDNSAFSASLDFGSHFSRIVDSSPRQLELIREWNQQSPIGMHLSAFEDLGLPAPLEKTFLEGKPLQLESLAGIEVHYLLPVSQKVLVMSMPLEKAESSRGSIELILTLSFYVGVVFLLGLWITPLIHQLIKLRKFSVKFGRGDLTIRAQEGRFSYIRDIEREFNRMAERIQTLVEDNKLLSRAVSHDLKTPLARLRFGLDALSETEDSALKQKYSVRVNRDLEEMENLVETLLQYARLDEARVSLKPEEFNLLPVLESVIALNTDDYIQAKLESDLPHVMVRADKRYIKMMFNNVVSNAARHAEFALKVSVEKQQNFVVVSVEDDGEGIAESDRELVTKPFWRGSSARDKQGHGMGLAIVAKIAEWHGVRLRIEKSAELGGAKIALAMVCD